MPDETATILTEPLLNDAQARVKYKSLYEELCEEKETLAQDLQRLHREMQAVRERLDHQLKVIDLQEQLIFVLKHHVSFHWPQSKPIDEEHPF